ncbi:MAG: aerobic carbon-monoxide dehydrogenase large subunit, partial [Gaiellaceae bacterium]|nr:aerobic carbon-monoxide dehydrogenase large subunit [Gaiellaceae bacterium]
MENLPLEGALTVTFVRSLLAHATIAGVDTTAAEALPNVQVLTAADMDLGPFGPPPFPGVNQAMGRPLLAVDRVRFVGDIIAIVVSDDRATGVDAAELVAVDYDPLPAVVDPRDAAKDEVLLFPEAGTNVAARPGAPEHDEKLFEGCDVVVSGTVVSQRMAACPLEPRSAAAELGPDGRITAWLSTQTPHQDRMVLAGTLGLEPEQVRVVAPDVGGGFGAKMLNVEEILVVWLARKL